MKRNKVLRAAFLAAFIGGVSASSGAWAQSGWTLSFDLNEGTLNVSPPQPAPPQPPIVPLAPQQPYVFQPQPQPNYVPVPQYDQRPLEAFCVAVGFRRNGQGRRIRGSRSVATLPVRADAPHWRRERRLDRACDQAISECRQKIAQLAGPYAICRVQQREIR